MYSPCFFYLSSRLSDMLSLLCRMAAIPVDCTRWHTLWRPGDIPQKQKTSPAAGSCVACLGGFEPATAAQYRLFFDTYARSVLGNTRLANVTPACYSVYTRVSRLR